MFVTGKNSIMKRSIICLVTPGMLMLRGFLKETCALFVVSEIKLSAYAYKLSIFLYFLKFLRFFLNSVLLPFNKLLYLCHLAQRLFSAFVAYVWIICGQRIRACNRNPAADCYIGKTRGYQWIEGLYKHQKISILIDIIVECQSVIILPLRYIGLCRRRVVIILSNSFGI